MTNLGRNRAWFWRKNQRVKVKVVNVPNAGEVLKTRVLTRCSQYLPTVHRTARMEAGVFEDLSNKDYANAWKMATLEKYRKQERVYNIPFVNATESTTNWMKFEEWAWKVPETWGWWTVGKDIVAKGQTPFGIAGMLGPSMGTINWPLRQPVGVKKPINTFIFSAKFH